MNKFKLVLIVKSYQYSVTPHSTLSNIPTTTSSLYLVGNLEGMYQLESRSVYEGISRRELNYIISVEKEDQKKMSLLVPFLLIPK